VNRKEQEKENLNKYKCPESDDRVTSGVLLSDEIEYYVK